MIDILKAKQAFKKYVNGYDKENYKIKIKIIHSQRVAEFAKEIAKRNKSLSQEEEQLAQLIGLLHDIGRFEQAKKYHTFIDKISVNHGELGVQILFEEGNIRNFIEETQYDEIIKKAILYHNRDKKSLEYLKGKEKLYSQIIRDADKMDILSILTTAKKEEIWGKENLSEEKMSDEIYKEFMEEQDINYQQRKTAVDLLVSHFAFVFDFNDKQSLQMVKENQYFEKLYQRFQFNHSKTKEQMEQIYKKVEETLERI